MATSLDKWTPQKLARQLAGFAHRMRLIAINELHHEPEFADELAQTSIFSLLLTMWLDSSSSTAAHPALTALIDETSAFLDSIDFSLILDADSVTYFYEDFLHVYDGAARKRRGVFYTPQAVVTYMVAAVDAYLREVLDLPLGLADTTTWKEYAATHPDISIPPTAEPTAPVVQIIDPATGTGIYLAEIVRFISQRLHTEVWADESPAQKSKKWARFVSTSLLPRLHGFELSPAPLAICRLNLTLALQATGYQMQSTDRINVHLQNALEPAPVELECAPWTVVIGNPPYSRSTSNRGAFIQDLVKAYKDPVRSEPNIQPLDDDYIKFLRRAENWIENLPLGVVSLVTNNTFYSGRIHRGIRKHLLETFDHITCLDLQETGKSTTATRKGIQPDENIFSTITEPTACTLMGRTPHRRKPRVSYHCLTGDRAAKTAWLVDFAGTSSGKPIAAKEPFYLFIPRDREYVVHHEEEYRSFIALDDLFDFKSVAGKPGKDSLLISFEPDQVIPKLERRRRAITPDDSGLSEAERKLARLPPDYVFAPENVIEYAYRPFDTRWTYYDNHLWTRGVGELYDHMGSGPVLLTSRIVRDPHFAHVFASQIFADVIFLSTTRSTNCYAFPLYDKKGGENLDVDKLLPTSWDVSALECFEYIYAVLHSPRYRSNYFEALKLDFPRIPRPDSKVLFETLANQGARLLALHTGQKLPDKTTTTFSFDDDLSVTQTRGFEPTDDDRGRLYINDSAYFDGLPIAVWNFFVGGHQVLYRWLYYRKRAKAVLTPEDIDHLLDVIAVIDETISIMEAIPPHRRISEQL